MKFERKLGYPGFYAFYHCLCITTPSDRGIPFSQNREIPIKSLCYVINREFPDENMNKIDFYPPPSGAFEIKLLNIFSDKL